MSEDLRLSSPSALRNRGPIAEVLRNILPQSGTILEIASGSGEHVTSFAASFPALTWQPSDPSVQARTSVSQWIEGGSGGQCSASTRSGCCKQHLAG
jgi:hypothetical protein